MANPEHVEVVHKGKQAIDEWRRRNPGMQLNLARADLTGAKLGGADLSRAFLVGADFWAANLSSASLTGAILIQADLTNADLSTANLSEASLLLTSLNGANLDAANVSQAQLGSTFLGKLDLSQVIGLADLIHQAPSSVGVDTLIRSFRGAGNKLTPELRTFFQSAGVPRELLDALPRIVAEVKYYSCFISYGQPDLAFATRLHEDLAARGVSCWLYEMDKTVGESTWHEIERKLEEYDKMVVVCSVDALMRDGVKKEIDKQIDKNPDKLLPVSLDNRWTHRGFRAEWGGRDIKAFLLERNYADFANLPYDDALERLLAGLRRPAG